MAEIKSIPISKIHVPEDRLREIDDNVAVLIAASIQERGLIQPIIIRSTPRRGDTPYTLVAGAYRLRAAQLLGLGEIECIVSKADGKDARQIEIEENLFRNELTALDRAVFVRTYRDLWEEQHGQILPGGDTRSEAFHSAKFAERSVTATAEFFRDAADRIGLSRRGIEYATFIADKLIPALRRKLQHTPAADNQSLLIRLAKLTPEKQHQLCQALDICAGDLTKALEAIDDTVSAKPSRDDKTYSTLLSTWGRTNARVRERFVDALGESEQRNLLEILKSRLGE